MRLGTTWTSDFPAQLTTLRIGDATNVPGAWGRAVQFGGVQYGTNFATQPGYITFPSLAANGQAALPSTVDVFVNNALVAQRPVPPGPFSITNIPTVNGSGNVQLVVRDLFGREQLISQPFYASVNLLKEGLNDYSFEAGFERQNFGVASSDYGPAIASATFSRGLTDQLTGQVHAELMPGLADGGVAANYLINEIGVASASAAVSGGDAGTGALGGVGFQRQTGQFSVNAQAQWTSTAFREIGATAQAPLPLRQLSGSLGYQLDRFGSANVTYVAQDFRSQPNIHVLSLGYSVGLGRWAFMSLSAAKTYGATGSIAFGATVSIPFDDRTLAAVSFNGTRSSSQGNSNDTSLTLQRSLPLGEGYGYRIVGHADGDVQASGSWQNDIGTYTLNAARFQGSTAGQVNIVGGIGIVGDHPFLSRQITDSFGVVRVADYPNDHGPAGQPAGRSHRRGRLRGVAAVARLRRQPGVDRRARPAARRPGRQAQDRSRAVLSQRTAVRLPGAAIAWRDPAHPPRRRRADAVGRHRPGCRPRRGLPGGAQRRGVRDRPRAAEPPARHLERHELRIRRRFPADDRAATRPRRVCLSWSGAMRRVEPVSSAGPRPNQRWSCHAGAAGVALWLCLSTTAAVATPSCSVSTPGLNFGGYDVFAAGAVNGNGTLSVTCNLNPPPNSGNGELHRQPVHRQQQQLRTAAHAERRQHLGLQPLHEQHLFGRMGRWNGQHRHHVGLDEAQEQQPDPKPMDLRSTAKFRRCRTPRSGTTISTTSPLP